QCGGLGAPLGFCQGFAAGDDRTEGVGLAVGVDVFLGHADDPQRVVLALLGALSPCGNAVAAQDAADGAGGVAFDGGDVESELESGTAPRHPHHLVSEDLLGELLPVSGGGDRDAGVGVQVVHVRGIHQSVHGGVDAGGGPAFAVQAVVEGGDHLVLAVD